MTVHLSYTLLLFEWEKKCFSDTFPWHLLSVSFRLKVAHTFRKTAVIERSGSFLSCASIQTQGVCALRHLCLREASPAKLCWEDLIRLWVGQTGLQAMKTSQAVPAVSPSTAGAWRCCCCSTGFCIRSLGQRRGAPMEYDRQFWCHFATWPHWGCSLSVEDFCLVSLKSPSTLKLFFLLAFQCSLSLGRGNTYCMRKTGGTTGGVWSRLCLAVKKKNIPCLLAHLQKSEYCWELPGLCYLWDWSLVNSRQQNELSRVAEYQTNVGCLD